MKTQFVKKHTTLIVVVAGLLIYAVSAFFALQNGDIKAFSGLFYAVSKALVGCAVLKAVDEVMLYEVPTMKILKENAVGYSIYMLGYAIIVALAFAIA